MKVQSLRTTSKFERFTQINLHKTLLVAAYNVLSDFLYILLAKVFRYRIEVIRKNLRNSFPGISQPKEGNLIDAYYRHLADLAIEPFLMNSLKGEDINSFISYENLHILNHQFRKGKDIVLVMSHYGNWEYLFSLPMVTEYEVIAVYSPLSNDFFNEKMKQFRSRFGVRLVEKADWYRMILKRKSEKPAIFLMICDQRPVPPHKYEVDFLGQKTFVQTGCDRIAQKLNCTVLYLDVEKTGRHYYKYRFVLLSEEVNKADEENISKLFYHSLENTIFKSPELWLWSHDRWKNQ